MEKMKKILSLAACFSMAIGYSLQLWAGGIDNKTNWSVEYLRILNRNAATDSADAVAYNPAGVMKMDEGLPFPRFYSRVGEAYTMMTVVNWLAILSSPPKYLGPTS